MAEKPVQIHEIVCAHCGELKTVTTVPGIIPMYCKPKCKKNAHTRRRRRRHAKLARGDVEPCPTPDRHRYETRELATIYAHNELVANHRVLIVDPEPCRCGDWHLSSPEEAATPEGVPCKMHRLYPCYTCTDVQPPALSEEQATALLDRFGGER